MIIRFIILSILLILSSKTNADGVVNLLDSIITIDHNKQCISTGFTIDEDRDYYYILASGHGIHYTSVDDDESLWGKKVKLINISGLKLDVTFYHSGKKQRFDDVLEVLSYHYDGRQDEYILDDFSVSRLSKKIVDEYGPPLRILSMSNELSDTKINQYYWTAGHPNGGWPTVYRGLIIENESHPEAVSIYPPSIVGRSGSPIMNYNMTKVIGMIIYSEQDVKTQIATHSGAVPVWKIKQFLSKYIMKGKK